MNEMVERVARALCKHDDLDWDAQANPLTSGSGDDNQAAYLSAARAAIEAMREPTEGMASEVGEIGVPDAFYADIWRAMIEEALK